MFKTYQKPKDGYELTDTLTLYVPYLVGIPTQYLKEHILKPSLGAVLLYEVEHHISIRTDTEGAAVRPLLSHAHNTPATESQCMCSDIHPKHWREYPGDIGQHGWSSDCDIQDFFEQSFLGVETVDILRKGAKYKPDPGSTYNTQHDTTLGNQTTGYVPDDSTIRSWAKKVATQATRHSVRWA